MTESFHHSVNNKLFLEVDDLNLSYLICNKSYQPLQHGKFPLLDSVQLAQLLGHNAVLHQIYGTVEVVYSGARFVVLPSQIIHANDRKKVFELSHVLPQSHQLVDGHISQAISIVYSVPKDTHEVLSVRYPNSQPHHELSKIYNWIGQKHKSVDCKILCRLQQEKLLIIVVLDGNLLLMNYFDCKSSDDAFYFIMSVVEQTEIDIEHTHLIWLGDFESAWEVSIEEVFQNYLKQVNVEHVMGTSLNKLGLGLRCILACES